MAAIERVGARIFILKAPSDLPEADSDVVNFGYQLYADLRIGMRVMTPHTSTLGVGRLKIPATLDALADMLLVSLRHNDLPEEIRAAFWGPLPAELKRFGIDTDAETVMRLPFVPEATDEVLELLGERPA
jgi:hypothetical protein